MSKKSWKKEIDISNFVNFNYEKYKPETSNARRSNTKSASIPFSKERFLQANYRFIVSPIGDYQENIVDPDLLVEWDNVEELCLKTHAEYKCPICLDDCVASRVSRCGHVYCYACIVRHLSYGNNFTGNCPICFSFIKLKDMKSAMVETVQQYKEGDTIEFSLLKRAKYSTMALPRSHWRAKTETYPLYTDPSTRFCRFAIIQDIDEIIDRDRSQLENQLWEATSSQDDSIPFIETALTELQEHQQMSRVYKKAIPKKDRIAFNAKKNSSSLSNSSSTIQVEPDKETKITKSTWDEPVQYDSIATVANTIAPKVQRQHEEEHVSDNNTTTTTTTSQPDVQLEKKVETLSLNSSGVVATEEPEENSLQPDQFFLIYQSNDGQQLFLHPLCVKVLLNQYGSYENFPDKLEGKITEIENYSQNENIRKRYKFLSHLPLTCQFQFIEIDMRPLVSKESIAPFQEDFSKRHRHRINLKRKEELEKLEKLQEEQNKFKQVINMTEFPSTPVYNYEEFQLESGFDTPLSQSPNDVVLSQSPSSNTNTVTNKKETRITSTSWPPTATESEAPVSFLNAAKSNKIAITSNMQIKQTSKGKQVVLMSTNTKRKYR